MERSCDREITTRSWRGRRLARESTGFRGLPVLVAARSGLAGSTTFAGCVLAVLVPLAPRLECTTACGQQRFGTAIFPEGNFFLLGFTEFDVLSLKREGLSGVRSHLG
ncbi:unnamed protein product [Prorocentrum cordatum]|uniref:Secreted protein n=1 Tax=Prorocentrum cordatum TaxID=2364126 RepID=A0ABN9U9X8_9DINO|nr:unnamed protein product [Polarella glacialis]